MKLNDNIYVIDLINFSISLTFNIDCLVDYKGPDVISLVDELSHEPILESPFLLALLDNFTLYSMSS